MSQKRTFQLLKEARKLGSYDEYPMLPGEVDPQLHVSRNDRPQPFYLICDGDTVFTLLSGKGRLEFHTPAIRYYPLQLADVVYVPAGTPHRYIPSEESVVVRTKASYPRLEGVAWYCDDCGHELHRHVWDARQYFCQEGYLTACTDFNEHEELRTCVSCSRRHSPVDISWSRWAQVVEELRQDGVSPAPVKQRDVATAS